MLVQLHRSLYLIHLLIFLATRVLMLTLMPYSGSFTGKFHWTVATLIILDPCMSLTKIMLEKGLTIKQLTCVSLYPTLDPIDIRILHMSSLYL